LPSCEQPEELGDHEAGEGEEVESSKGCRQSFVVASQPAETGSPGDASFHQPSAWQQHEATFYLDMFC
jgi:hypothetical protein